MTQVPAVPAALPASNEKPAWVVTLVAAALPLLATPLGLALLAFFAPSVAAATDLSRRASVGTAFEEGGSWMHVVTVAGVVAGVGCAGVVALMSRWKQGASPLAAFSVALVVAAGVVGTRFGLNAVVNVLGSVNPVDRRIIAFAAVHETWWAWVYALLVAASVLALFALSFVAEYLGRLSTEDSTPRRFSLVNAIGLGALSVWLVSSAARELAWSAATAYMAHASVFDRATLVVDAVMQMRMAQHFATGALVVSVLVLLGGAAWLRAKPAAAVALCALLVVPAQVVLGQAGLSLPDRVTALLADWPPADVVELDAPLAFDPPSRVLTEAAPDDLGGATESVGLLVTQKATAASLGQAFASLGTGEVELVGTFRRPPVGFDVPPLFGSIFSPLTAVRVLVRPSETACPTECDFATLSERGLQVGGTTWSFEALGAERWPTSDELSADPVLVRASAVGDPPTLMRAALTAAKHHAPLVVVTAPPEP